MEIKVLGTKCSKCTLLFDTVSKTLNKHHIDAHLTKVEDMMEILSYNITALPALVINDEVVSKGILLSEEEILMLLNNYTT